MADADARKSQAVFGEIETQHDQGRKEIIHSKQAQIAQRILRVKREMLKLKKELNASEP